MKERNYGRRCDRHYKKQAVQLLLSSGKTINQVSKELGISRKALQSWKETHLRKTQTVEHAGPKSSSCKTSSCAASWSGSKPSGIF